MVERGTQACALKPLHRTTKMTDARQNQLAGIRYSIRRGGCLDRRADLTTDIHHRADIARVIVDDGDGLGTSEPFGCQTEDHVRSAHKSQQTTRSLYRHGVDALKTLSASSRP